MNKIVISVFLLVFIFTGCATSNIGEGDFVSSTLRIPNRTRSLGMVGETIETIDSEVATGYIPRIRVPLIRRRIQITSVGEGSALLLVSNRMAQIAIIYIDVLPTGEISHRIIRHIDQPDYTTFLTGTTWSLVHENGTETIQFFPGTRGTYTLTEIYGGSYFMHFRYIISGNEIVLLFTASGIMITIGAIYENSMTLVSIDDHQNETNLVFTKTEEGTL